MQPTRLSCWQCGTVLSAAGGRCPSCGAEQPDNAVATLQATGTSPSADSVVNPARPVRAPEPAATTQAKTLPWVLLAVGLAGIGLIAAAFSPKGKDEGVATPARSVVAPPPPAEPPRADPNDIGVANPASVDPVDLLARAKTRALSWSRDAMLVSLRATPVASGRVDLTNGGAIEYWFANPAGDGFAPGARVSGKRLRVKVDASGSHVDDVTGGTSRAALEPNCPLEEAVRKAQAGGIPQGAPVTVSYEYAEKPKKPTWKISSVGDEKVTRLVDGFSCAIVVR